MAINVEAGVTKRMKLNSQWINYIRISGNHWRPELHARTREGYWALQWAPPVRT
jgi:hypothetical protein